MIPYLVLLGVFCIEYIFLISFIHHNPKKLFLIVAAIELIVFTGLRSPNIGSDTTTYVNAIDLFKGISFFDIFNVKSNPLGFEAGYLIFGKILSFLNASDTCFLFIVAIIIYVPFFIFVYRESLSPLISILAYFAFSLFYHSLGIFRQMIAISICLMAIPSLKEKKMLKYMMIIVAASLFHTTALCWILLYFLANIKTDRYKNMVIPISAACIPLGGIISKAVLKILPKYAHYVGSAHDTSGGSFLMFLLIMLTFVAYQISIRKKHDLSRTDEITFAGLSLALCFQGIAYSFGLMGRAICYFSLFETLAFPKIVGNLFKSKKPRILVSIFLACGLIAITILFQFRNNKYICPFTFFWE